MLRYLIAFSLCCAAPLVARADEPPVQVPVQLASFHGPAAGSCVQVPADPAAFDHRFQQAQCLVMDDAQMFEFEPEAKGGYRVRNLQSGACIDAVTFSPPGAPVINLPCNGQDNQRWEVSYAGGNPNTAMLRNAMTGLCLGFGEGIAVQASCDVGAGSGPGWVVSRQAERLPGGATALRSVRNGQCLSLDEFPVATACTNDGNSNLRVNPLDDAAGTFRLLGAIDGSCLVQVEGTAVYDTCLTGGNAHWRLVETAFDAPAANGEKAVRWQVQNVASEQCLHVERGSVGPEGETVTVWPCDASDNALWQVARY